MPWRVVVFDEFHGCKNKRSETYESAKGLQARIKIGLTGTPIQNNLEELWALLSLVAPHLAKAEKDFKCVRPSVFLVLFELWGWGGTRIPFPPSPQLTTTPKPPN